QQVYTGQIVGATTNHVIVRLQDQKELLLSLSEATSLQIDDQDIGDREKVIASGAKAVAAQYDGKTVRVVVDTKKPEMALSIRTISWPPLFAMIGLALIPVLWTYSGWHEAAYVVAEVREERRTIPLALMLGTGFIMLIYLGVNLAFLTGLGFERSGESRT